MRKDCDCRERSQEAAATGLLEQMLDEDSEILTIIYGEDVSEEDVESLQEYIEQKYGEVEVEVHNGNSHLLPISSRSNRMKGRGTVDWLVPSIISK